MDTKLDNRKTFCTDDALDIDIERLRNYFETRTLSETMRVLIKNAVRKLPKAEVSK